MAKVDQYLLPKDKSIRESHAAAKWLFKVYFYLKGNKVSGILSYTIDFAFKWIGFLKQNFSQLGNKLVE